MLLLACAALLLSVGACAVLMSDEPETVEQKNFIYENGTYGVSEPGVPASYNESYISQNTPEEYYIAYAVHIRSGGQHDASEVIAARQGGRIYFSSDGNESLFTPVEGGYFCYTRNAGSSRFSGMNPGAPMNEDAVGLYVQASATLFSYYTIYNGMVKTGEETVAGRRCAVYSVLNGDGFPVSFCIDVKTGICLKAAWLIDEALKREAGTYEFECTEFKVTNIILPSID